MQSKNELVLRGASEATAMSKIWKGCSSCLQVTMSRVWGRLSVLGCLQGVPPPPQCGLAVRLCQLLPALQLAPSTAIRTLPSSAPTLLLLSAGGPASAEGSLGDAQSYPPAGLPVPPI